MELKRNLGVFILILVIRISLELPDLTNTSTEPVVVNTHETAMLPCTVKNLSNFTVVWKRIKFGRMHVLTANTLKITNDIRISAMHTSGGDDWVLVINNARSSDSGEYICEVNSIPAFQVSVLLSVRSTPNSSFPLAHNYTSCCIQQQVPQNCLGFCTLQNIILGNTGTTPHNCREHLPVIAECMADGRNHTPCCIREKIPEVCRDVCVGKFGLLNETVVNHYTCSKFSRVTLACIAEGIEILPGPPIEVQVEPLSESEIKVSWSPPKQNFNTITHYVLNLTELSSFDVTDSTQEYDSLTNDTEEDRSFLQTDNHFYKSSREINITSSALSTIIENLMPFTMYEIYLTSVNSYGSSLPTYRLRTLTLMPQSAESSFNETLDDNFTFPSLPDIRGCCAEKGMAQERCLDLFCDPVKADLTNLTDVMICAPWISASVTCLTGGKDYTACCRQRGLPELCIPLCQGNITRIDYSFFRCIPYMNSYTSCLMQGYGVVSGAPRDPVIQNVHSNWAIIKWNPPLHLASTVISYNVHYRLLSPDAIYTVEPLAKSPYLLDGLLPNTEYEVYITSVNQFGTSEGSPRVVFQTLPGDQLSSESSSSLSSYNLTECCLRAQLKNSCMPLCDYRAKMADLQRLASSCMSDFHKLLKCGVAGRNHMPCCMRRMVNVNCASLCAGMVSQFSSTAATMCIPYIPDIIQCMEEGNEKLPGPIKEFHALDMNSSAVILQWEPPENSSILLYEVHYQGEVMNNTSNNSSNFDKIINVTETHILIDDLEPDILYSFYVVVLNEYGSSMPSSILTFITNSAEKAVKGVVSPPHSLMVTVRNITSLTVTWLPPDFSHPSDAIAYNVHFKPQNETEYTNFTTTALITQIQNLKPGTEYTIYITAFTEQGESWPSEMLFAWTDSVYPAFVEMPRVHPSTQIEEGSSMTVFCVATGTPIPLVAVFINGKKIFEEVTRHMVAVISNVSRTTNTISCTANNGYGPGSHAVKHIKVSYSPRVEAKEKTSGNLGQRAILECIANGYPQPQLMWWRDKEKEIPVVSGGKNVIRVRQTDSEDFIFQLILTKTTAQDEGSYFCTAENPYGKAIDEVYLQFDKRVTEQPSNVSDCCHQQMVNPDCLDACSFDVDIDTVINQPKCIPEMNKLMHCAADGSDHRRCCQTWGVPRRCIALCQGKAVQNPSLCILAWSKQIISCFQEGRKILPGTPLNVRLNQISDTSLIIQWDPPLKNPHVVQYYRVYGKSLSSNKMEKVFQNDTHGLSMTVTGLKSDGHYEFVIKAGNHYGTSLTTAPIRISLSNNNIEARIEEASSNSSAVIIGIILTVIILILIIAGIFYLRHKYQPRSLGGVSFENPSYMRETLSDGTQPNGIQEQTNPSRTTVEPGWKSETLHAHGTDNAYVDSGDEMSNIKKTKAIFH